MINSIFKVVQGWIKVKGDTSGTFIGNVADALKVSVENISKNALKMAGADVLGNLVTGKKNNQVEISFESAPSADLITNTTSGTASITYTAGHALYATGTGTTAQAKGVSVGTIFYRPANEIYGYFTASFTTPTSAASYQRIGVYDTNNGFFIGYEGTSFGITKRTNGVDTRIAQASFNKDTLTGVSGSDFTRAGVPESYNPTFSNLFRIRFAWLGSASICFEIFSPDGEWVTFHVIYQPNSELNPSLTSPDLKMTLDVSKTASDSTNLIVYTACWAGGTTSDLSKITDNLSDNTLAALTRSVIAGRSSTGGGTYYNVKVTPSGALTTETTQAGAVVSDANSTSTLLNANATFTGTSEDVSQYGVISVVVRSNVDSAVDGLQFLFSTDNVTFYSSDEYTILAGKFKTYSIAPVAKYFKIQYQNGATNQSQFLLQTIYKQVYVKPSSHRLADSLSAQDDAEVVQSILVAKLPDGNFTNINTTRDGHLIFEPAQNQKDAFDRLIVVEPTQLSSYDYRINKHLDDFDEVISGSATSVHNATTVSVDMTCTTASGDSVKRQSFESYEYVRGNTQQGLFSLNLNGGPKTNNMRMFGLGDVENGAFIGVDGTGFFVMRRSKTSGSVVDTKVYQTNFNYDKLDGTGVSQITLDLTKQNLFSIAYSWLGTNVIIYTLTVAGVKRPFHIDSVGNSLDTAWCQSGQLPLYFENTNTGTTASNTTFKVGCAAVFSFGSTKGFREYLSVSSGATAITINATDKVCAGIRLRPGRKYVYIEPSDYQLLAASGTTVAYYRIIKNAVLTGATWVDNGEISQILTNNPTFTNGTVVQEGYFALASAARLAINIPTTQEVVLGSNIAGTTDSLIIVVRTDSGNGSFFFSGSWKEVF